MVYERSKEIEGRLAELLVLLRQGGYSTPALAVALRISKPTVSRCITALRERGHTIRSIKGEHGWSYEVVGEAGNARKRRRA